MSADPSGRRRVIGLALLGVAAVATVMGVVTLINSRNTQTGTGAPPATTSVSASVPATSHSETPPPPSSGNATTTGQQTSATPPPSPTGSPPPSTSTQPSEKSTPIRVYNNSKITGLAERAAADLRSRGWNVVEVGNYPDGIIGTTTAYYRQGTDEEAAARLLASTIGLRIEPRFPGIEGASPGVILIVTKDYTWK